MGGTVGFLARKRADSGVGIARTVVRDRNEVGRDRPAALGIFGMSEAGIVDGET